MKTEYARVGLQIDQVFLKKTDHTVKALNREGLKTNRSEAIEAILASFLISEGTTAAATKKVKELIIWKRKEKIALEEEEVNEKELRRDE